MNRLLVSFSALVSVLLAASCQSTSVRTFSSPQEATEAIVAAAEAGDRGEASRIFDTFARSSVQRDRVYAELYDAAQARYDSGQAGAAAQVFGFVCERYPGAVAAKEARVLALFLARAEVGVADPAMTTEIEAAVSDVRAASPTPSPWVDLAATQAAIDAGDLGGARTIFADFLGAWDGQPEEMMIYVEDLDRMLGGQ